jgi:hypothetical protein
MRVSDDTIDAIVRGAVDDVWRKVAMIVAIGLCDPKILQDDDEDIVERIAHRIQWFIEIDEFEVAGDPARWRHSEVRRSR